MNSPRARAVIALLCASLAACAVGASGGDDVPGTSPKDDEVPRADAGTDVGCADGECETIDASVDAAANRETPVTDECPNDPDKTEPGTCGCGQSDADTDEDGTPDCDDACPADPDKTEPGACGCGQSDADSDEDDTPDCNDECPDDPDKAAPGACGCGQSDADGDEDDTPDCNDGCPGDPNKTEPGDCGCGLSDDNAYSESGVLVCACASGLRYADGECIAECGDGLVAPDEECDDGNASDNDACTTSCRRATCGDGILKNQAEPVEQCDDGNADSTDGCVACQIAECGDGFVQQGVEECDGDGNGDGTPTAACTASCRWAICGDGLVNASEHCDGDGEGTPGLTASCDSDCTAVVCGDGVVNARAGEYCDHGGDTSVKGCDENCHARYMKLGSRSDTETIDDPYENWDIKDHGCGRDAVAVGLHGRAGQWLDELGLQCRKLDDSFYLEGPTEESGEIGNSGGGEDFTPLACPADQLLVGLTVRYDTHFRYVQGLCKPGAEIILGYAHDQSPTRTGALDLPTSNATTTETLTCPTGSVVSGIGGAEGAPTKYISSIYLECREMEWDL